MKIFHHIGSFACAFSLMYGSAQAGEYAVLSNGFRLYADRHENAGERIRLFTGIGVTEISAAEVSGWEAEEATPAPSPAVAAAPSVTTAPAALPPAGNLLETTAKKHGLPSALIRSIVQAESNGRANAVSPKGAIGLMQLMPETAKKLGADAHIPEENVDAGTRYLRELLARYEDKEDQVARAIAAYNAGPGAVDRYNGVPPYAETQIYVRRVLKTYNKLKTN